MFDGTTAARLSPWVAKMKPDNYRLYLTYAMARWNRYRETYIREPGMQRMNELIARLQAERAPLLAAKARELGVDSL